MPQASSLAVLIVAALAGAAGARPQPTYIRIKPTAEPSVAPGTLSAASSKIVYLRRCKVGLGCSVREGNDDSRTDTSSIVSGNRVIGEFTRGDDVWNATVECVKQTFAPFDITVTDVDPGTVPHFENVVGGKPEDLGRSDLSNAGGVAPFTCNEIPNAIVYTFDVYGPDPEQLCWTSAQEVAHAFGLDHEFLQKDPMTYIGGDLPKRFRDVDTDCGEFDVRACGCPNRPKQNSYRTIVGLFGPGAPTPPTVTVQRPTDGKTVQPGFRVTVQAVDDVRVEKIELFADGNLVATQMMPSSLVAEDKFDITGPTDLAMGPHTLEIRATDVQGVPASATIAVTQGPPCTPDKGCEGSDVCVGGICLPGPDEPGGLGTKCQSDAECLSHKCTDAQEEFKHCTEACDPANNDSCPNEFECLTAGASGLCWPNPSGGCCDAGTTPQGPVLMSLGLGILLLRRRRSRR